MTVVRTYQLRLGGEFHNATGTVSPRGAKILALGPVAMPSETASQPAILAALELAGLAPSVSLPDVRVAWARAHAREAQREALILALRGLAQAWDAKGLGDETDWLRRAAMDLEVLTPTAEHVCHAASLLAYVHDRRADLCFLAATGQDVRAAMGALVVAYLTP